MAFFQESFFYKDLYQEGTFLKDIVHHFFDQDCQSRVDQDLSQFSSLAATTILDLAFRAEASPPQHQQFDPWGRRIDEIVMTPAWNELHAVSAQQGIVALGYERESGADSRLHQFLKLMIFHPSSAFYSCPLAMTDGAASVLEEFGGELKEKYFPHLTSRDPLTFWTAGQWMTEKNGGSDVSQSETYATFENGVYHLWGVKWFTSAITAQLAMALAQTDVKGEKKLSLFLVPIRNENGELNNIEVLRLKDKLGTRAMPTAELELKGTPAYLVGELGKGVKNITCVLNISRLYNAACATGTLLRLQSLATDYACKRKAFGKTLIHHPLHSLTLLQSRADTQASVLFVVHLSKLLGKKETQQSKPHEDHLLRLLTPVAKLWTAKKAMMQVSELIESFGGAGYIEDTHLPRFLRDTQVFSIWEGTTNIMSLDTLRALGAPASQQKSLLEIQRRLDSLVQDPKQKSLLGPLYELFKTLQNWLVSLIADPQKSQWGARSFAMSLGDFYAGLLMLEFAAKTQKERDVHLAKVYITHLQSPNFQGTDENVDEVQKTLES